MLKYLLVIGVIAFVYYFFIKKTPVKRNNTPKEKPSDMVECSACGTYCEIDDAIISNGKYFCSNECVGTAK